MSTLNGNTKQETRSEFVAQMNVSVTVKKDLIGRYRDGESLVSEFFVYRNGKAFHVQTRENGRMCYAIDKHNPPKNDEDPNYGYGYSIDDAIKNLLEV